MEALESQRRASFALLEQVTLSKTTNSFPETNINPIQGWHTQQSNCLVVGATS